MSVRPNGCNIARHLPRLARDTPDRPAVVTQKDGVVTTFAELEKRTNRYANGLRGIGMVRGTRVLVMIKPGLEFTSVVFALLKLGALPVMVDAGMGIGNMLRCIGQVAPEAMIGLPQARMLRLWRPGAFKSIKQMVTVGRRWLGGGYSLAHLHDQSSDEFEIPAFRPMEQAAILFTSGSTGPAKGVVYEHGMFDAQVRSLKSCYGFEDGEVELATFPLFALFCPALGMTCVFPDMDFSRPGRVDPERIVRAVGDYGPTSAFGSPALWNKVSAYCLQHDLKLTGLRRVLIAGAPVDWRLIERLTRCLADTTEIHTPYGATEALPVASVTGGEILGDCLARTRSGAGICVGKIVPGRKVEIIRIIDGPIGQWSKDLVLPPGQKGEIVVSGEAVTKEYASLPEATAKAKIADGDRVWHRLGDIGYFDETGRLWYCGRKSHRVEASRGPMFSICCEAVFNEHRGVARSALVGVGRGSQRRPVIVVEPVSERRPASAKRQALPNELLQLGREREITRNIGTVLVHPSFPVDVRHNAKINREELAAWAERRLR